MKVSLEWISDFVQLPAGVTADQLAHELTLKTVEVEDVIKIDDDVVLEIDNKSLTNRPDLWGHYGIAREFAAIYQLPLEPLARAEGPEPINGLIGSVDPDICPRFAAVSFALGEMHATPELVRRRLARIGELSVNLVVDLSNYVMFTVGQPTHVYDADRVALPLSAGTVGRQQPLELLVGRKVEPAAGTPVITDGAGLVGIAGVMGSAASAVTAESRSFVLEAATFRAQPIRRASQQLGLRTEASARYEKALDTQRVDLAIDLFLQLLRAAAPGVSIFGMQDVATDPTAGSEVTVSRDFLDRRIGQTLPDDEVEGTLSRLGFGVAGAGDELRITVPTWRSTGDVSLPQDIVEEVARIHGYDALAVARTKVALEPVRSRHLKPLDRVIREQLALRGGLQEVVTYPWTVDYLLDAAGCDKAATVRFDGAPAPDRDSLRPSLLPNMLETIAANLRYQSSFGAFEVGTVFSASARSKYKSVYEAMPPQSLRLAVALVGSNGVELFRKTKGLLQMTARHAHMADLSLSGDGDEPWADSSARLAVHAHGSRIGTLALLTPKTRRLAGIQGVHVAYAELELDRLTAHASRDNHYTAVPDLPEADFDLSVVVADDIAWSVVEATARPAHELVSAVSYVDEFRGSWVPAGHRSLTLRVTLRPKETTLTSDVIGAARNAVLEALTQGVGAHLR